MIGLITRVAGWYVSMALFIGYPAWVWGAGRSRRAGKGLLMP
jgi:hypothetical protein